MSRLRIGTCGCRLSPGVSPAQPTPEGIGYLQEYTRTYNTIELDRWFWPPPDSREPMFPQPWEVEAYRRCVPPDFRFTVLVPLAITLGHHHGRSPGDPPTPNPHLLSPDLMCRFVESLEPLGDGLGPLILQFSGLGRDAVAGQEDLLARLSSFLDQVPGELQYAVDTVEREYRNAAQFEFIARHGLVPVLVQELLAGPSIREVHGTRRDLIVRGHAVVVKVLGEEWSTGVKDRIYLDGPPEDDGRVTAEIVRDLLGAGLDVYVNMVEFPRWPERHPGSAPSEY